MPLSADVMSLSTQPSSKTDMARATLLGVALLHRLGIDDMSIWTIYFQTHPTHLRVESGCPFLISELLFLFHFQHFYDRHLSFVGEGRR